MKRVNHCADCISCPVTVCNQAGFLCLQVHSAMRLFHWQAPASGPAASGAPPHAQPTPPTPRPTRANGPPPHQAYPGGGLPGS